MAKSAGYVSAEYLRKVAALGKQIKQRSYELMTLAPGHHVLDVGCGPGIDTVPLGQLVGPHGCVVGVDIDEDMLQQADAAAQQAQLGDIVQHQQADVAALPFADETFDACHAERLFQVLPSSYDRHAVFTELVRVVHRGGRVVVADTDWATASVDYPGAALERRLMNFFAGCMRPNGYAGRQLYDMYRQQALQDIQIEVFPLVQSDFTQSPFGSWLVGEALAAGVATQSELDGWMRELTARHEQGRFFWSVNLVLVAGVKGT
ncbi:MAG: methyltransferase domain-containing protein [Pseudomonadota bacterium]